MTDRPTDPSLQDIHRGTLIAGVVLVVAGAVLGVMGFGLSAASIVVAGRRWYRRADLPPHHLASLKWEQAKAAAGAGAGAWRDTEKEKYTPRSLQAR